MPCAGWFAPVRRSDICRAIFRLGKPVYQQSQRWIKAGVFEAMVADLREILRLTTGRKANPSAVIFDSRTLQQAPESGNRTEYDGAQRKKGSKTHIAVDTLGNLLALLVTPANEQDRAMVGELAEKVQAVTGAGGQVGFCRSGLHGRKCQKAS